MYSPRSRSALFAFLLLTVIFAFPRPSMSQDEAPTRQDPPISYGLVIDNSGSYRRLLEDLIRFASAVLGANVEGDETFFVRFVDTQKIKLEQEFTTNTREVLDSVENMYVEGGQKSILDAVRSSGVYLAENARTDPGRLRSIVLVTDGDERFSLAKPEETIDLLKKADIRVYAVAISEEAPKTKLLERLTRETGGRLYVMKNKSELRSAAAEVAAAIRKP